MRRALLPICAALGIALAESTASAVPATKAYVVPIGDAYDVVRLLSVGERVPETSSPGHEYQLIGIPDGLGATQADGPDRYVTLLMNHELDKDTLSEPLVGGPMNRGAFVSRFLLDEDGSVLSGERAYDTVYTEDTLVGPAPEVGNVTPSFGRFCSGSLAATEVGFDRPIYLTGEESTGSTTFDGRGGQTVAVFDNELHTLPAFGRFAKENTLVMPRTGRRTVAFTLEDGPSGPDSQLYLYIGEKDRFQDASVLERNGLVGGVLYAFRSLDSARNTEATFHTGTIDGEWARIPHAGQYGTDAELEAAADTAGAFGFVRIEDGAFDKERRRVFYFVTTGGNSSAGNGLGRLYQLKLRGPSLEPRLRVVYNGDQVIEAGEDTAISPDNLDTSEDFLMINEDPTSPSEAIMASKNRDASVWRFPLGGGPWPQRVRTGQRTRVAELDPPGWDGLAADRVWETSGVLDTSALFGEDTWLTDVQAHPPTTPPEPNTVQDGQLVLLAPEASNST